ncbi:MAG: HEAT repeat domain-containing protein [Planctomycetes bacterium]|nr:HEAT repeat domain-containing protein [Planctomycetota bacterium]
MTALLPPGCGVRAALAAGCLVALLLAPLAAQERRAAVRTPAAVFAEVMEARRAADATATEAAASELAAWPRLDVLPILIAAADPARGKESCGAALAVLERMGLADDAAFAASLLQPGLEEDLRRALVGLARRDARTLAALEALLRTVSSSARVAFVRAVEDLRTPAAAVWLARCAERAPDVRGEALARLGRLGEALPLGAPAEALDAVRSLLAGVETRALRDAVVACGRLEDGDAVPLLIALLGDEDRGLSADAAWSLQRITGLALRDRRDRWEHWYQSEAEWWRERSDRAFAALDSGDAAVRTRAILELSGRRTAREQLAQRLTPLLEDRDPEVARLSAWALGVLRTKAAVPALLAALEQAETPASGEAWKALRAIARKDLPREPAACRAALGL